MAANDEYAKVVNGVVTRVIVADASFIATLADAASWVLTPGPRTVGGGFTHDGQAFTVPASQEYARVDNGIVIRVISATAPFIANIDDSSSWIPTPGIGTVQVGYTYDGQTFTAP